MNETGAGVQITEFETAKFEVGNVLILIGFANVKSDVHPYES